MPELEGLLESGRRQKAPQKIRLLLQKTRAALEVYEPDTAYLEEVGSQMGDGALQSMKGAGQRRFR